MNIIDRIAARFGYVKAPISPLLVESEPASADVPIRESAIQQQHVPADFGLSDDVTFDVVRAGRLGSKPASWTDLLDFVDACGVDLQALQGEFTLASVVAGIPLHVDGAEMAFRVRH